MSTATLFGGARDGEHITLTMPFPEVLQFPERSDVTGVGPTAMERLVITSVSYRLRLKPRCCATWCTWPRPCTCCPRCSTAPLIYDLVRA